VTPMFQCHFRSPESVSLLLLVPGCSLSGSADLPAASVHYSGPRPVEKDPVTGFVIENPGEHRIQVRMGPRSRTGRVET
jgi:hypothetical protein